MSFDMYIGADVRTYVRVPGKKVEPVRRNNVYSDGKFYDERNSSRWLRLVYDTSGKKRDHFNEGNLDVIA